MKVSVNDGCIGCGLCENICPEIFVMDDGISTVIENVDYAKYVNEARAAADGCPVSVIEVEE